MYICSISHHSHEHKRDHPGSPDIDYLGVDLSHCGCGLTSWGFESKAAPLEQDRKAVATFSFVSLSCDLILRPRKIHDANNTNNLATLAVGAAG